MFLKHFFAPFLMIAYPYVQNISKMCQTLFKDRDDVITHTTAKKLSRGVSYQARSSDETVT